MAFDALWTRSIAKPCSGIIHVIDAVPRPAYVSWGDDTPDERVWFDQQHTDIDHTYPPGEERTYPLQLRFLDNGQTLNFDAMVCGTFPGRVDWRPAMPLRVVYDFPATSQVWIRRWSLTEGGEDEILPASGGKVTADRTFKARALHRTSFIIDRAWHGTVDVEPGITLDGISNENAPCCLTPRPTATGRQLLAACCS